MLINFLFAVFMKDISKQTLENLITFMYSGEVNIKQDELEEFLGTANALEIKGLGYAKYSQSSDLSAIRFECSALADSRSQYQSTQTLRVPNLANSTNIYELPESTLNQYPKQPEIYSDQQQDDLDEISGNGYNSNGNFDNYHMDNDGELLSNQQNNVRSAADNGKVKQTNGSYGLFSTYDQSVDGLTTLL